MKYHAIGYMVILLMLSGCEAMQAMPVTPEITIKIGLKPAVIIQREEPSNEAKPD